jgi:branched-chain amino acid transport system permease protein
MILHWENQFFNIATIIVEGMETVLGAIMGSVFMVLLPEVINSLCSPVMSMNPSFATRIGAISVIVYGLVIIFFLLFESGGLFGIWMKLKRFWKPWPFKYEIYVLHYWNDGKH